jgi:xanthine dehydrogenase accessory factor
MIGSKHKVASTMDNLKKQGVSEESLEAVHAPIGLAIGAVTASEIAISILAEIISIYRKDTGSVRLDPKLLKTLGEETGYILARVVKKSGSAPCDVGFQIVVFSDGSTQGTVGGGLVEANAIAHARSMLADKTMADAVVEYTLDNTKAGSLGMICKGEVALLFQRQ